MNLAIIIGISKYSNTANDLPGSKNDALAMYEIINGINKFEQILFINENESSSKVKELTTNFIVENRKSNVNEVFFYYSGHGEYLSDEFYFLLSDFDPKKRKQSSFQNTEIDDLIRSLQPELVTKVIDACQSGTTYIKDFNHISKYFEESKKSFKKCYFMNSSLNDQYSFQTDTISDFTLSFLKALKEHDTEDIRYKDIIDYISDEFASNQNQTPFFVIQAEYTEKFCTLSKALKEYLAGDFKKLSVKKLSEVNTSLPLLKIIELEAQGYITKEEAERLLYDLQYKIQDKQLDSELAQIFRLEYEFSEKVNDIPNVNIIGKWLDENDNNYFAEPKVEYKEVVKQSALSRFGQAVYPISAFSVYSQKMLPDTFYDTVRQINGVEILVDMPYRSIRITINSNYQNVYSYFSAIVMLLSKKSIRFFSFITNYIEDNWDSRKLNNNITWFSTEHKITDIDDIMSGFDEIYKKINEKIISELNDKFKINDESIVKDTDEK